MGARLFYPLFLIAVLPTFVRGETKTFDVGTGDWFVGANWNPEGVPAVGDDVVIAGGRTVQLGAAATVASLELSGTVTGTGSLTVTGAMTWTSGTMSGSGVTNAQGGLNITGFVSLSGRTLNNGGTALMNGFGNLSPSNNGVLNNQVGAVFEIANDNGISFGGTVNNGGGLGGGRRAAARRRSDRHS